MALLDWIAPESGLRIEGEGVRLRPPRASDYVEWRELRAQSRELEEQLAAVTREWQAVLDWFPNWPHPDMPEGESDADNVEECAWVPGTGYLDDGLANGNLPVQAG